MASTLSPGIATQSQIKLPPVIAAKPKAPPPPSAPLAKPSSIVAVGKPKEDLGLYTAAKAVPAAVAGTPEALETNEKGVVAGTGRVVLDIEASDSGYANKIYYSTDNFKTRQYVGIDNQTGTVDLGTFKPGTTIQFGIDNGQGDFFTTGGKSANADQVDHTQVSKLADGGVRVGFEDLRGGGDRDFNDAIIKVRSVPAAAPPVSASAPAFAPVSGNPTALVPPRPAAAPVVAKPDTAKPVLTPAAVKDAPLKPATTVPATPAITNTAVKPATPAPVANKDVALQPTIPAVAPAPAAKPATTTVVPVAAKPAAATTASTTAATAPKPATSTTTAAAKPVAQTSSNVVANDKGNRSGLGDGTNPGQGSGTVNSPNQGTLNPGGVR